MTFPIFIRLAPFHWFFLLLFALTLSPVTAQESNSDEALTAKLRDAFHQVEGLNQVTLEVRGGVAVLRGTVPSLESKMRAEELALKLDGVLTVDNGLTVESRVDKRLSPALSGLYEKVASLLAFLPLMLVAGVLMTLFVVGGNLLRRWDWLYQRASGNVFVQDTLKQFTSFVFAMAGVLLALELVEATALVGAVLGTAGVLGIAVGFAFRDFAENSLASVLLSLRQPFAPNDLVDIDGHEGKVVRLTSRATILLTLDGNHLRLPNAAVFKATILNYTRNPERRFAFCLGVGTGEQLAPAQALAVRTLGTAPGVLANPKPQCLVEELGDSTVRLGVYGWVDQRTSEYLKVKSEAIRRVKEAFDEAGIIMPEPIYKVRLEHLETEKFQENPKFFNPKATRAPMWSLNGI